MSLCKHICRIFCLALLASVSLFGNALAAPEALQEFQWKNRLIIVCDLQSDLSATDLGDPRAKFPPKEFAFVGSAAQILVKDQSERKLVLITVMQSVWAARGFEYFGDGQRYEDELGSVPQTGRLVPNTMIGYALGAPNYSEKKRLEIAEYIDCQPGDRLTALVGLDGDVKHTWRDEVPSPEEVFALIDAMPMRLNELGIDRAE